MSQNKQHLGFSTRGDLTQQKTHFLWQIPTWSNQHLRFSKLASNKPGLLQLLHIVLHFYLRVSTKNCKTTRVVCWKIVETQKNPCFISDFPGWPLKQIPLATHGWPKNHIFADENNHLMKKFHRISHHFQLLTSKNLRHLPSKSQCLPKISLRFSSKIPVYPKNISYYPWIFL